MNFFKKIMLQEKEILNKISKNSTYLKLISLGLAVLLFFTLNGTGSLGLGDAFKTEKYISNIPVNIVKDDGKIVTGIPDTIGVNVRGSEVNIKNFEKNYQNIEATINLSGRDDGEYDIGFDEFQFSQDYGVEIIPLATSYHVTIDTLTEITMPLDVEYINKAENESVILSKPVLDNPNVTFSVGQMQKDNIASVRVILDISKIDTSKDENEYVYEEPIKVYDKEGNLMDLPNELPTVKITQTYELKSILKPVRYQIINKDTKKYVSYVCKEKEGQVYNENCQDTVEVYGDEEKIQELSYVTYNVDLKDFDENSPLVLATPALESGVFIDDAKGYNVKVGVEDGTVRTFKNVPIVVENKSDKIEVVNLDDINLDVKITGAESIVNDLTINDFEVYIDAAGITNPNIVSVPLQVSMNSLLSYELSENEINVEFKEK